MPGRTRRVRLVAVFVCIVTVFFLYERSTAGADQYADYWTRNKIGGGAVLRKPDDEQQQSQHQQETLLDDAIEPEPVSRPQMEPWSTKTTSRSNWAAEGTPIPTTSESSLSTSFDAAIDNSENVFLPTKTPSPDPPNFYGDGETDDDRLGSSNESWDDSNQSPFSSSSRTRSRPIHWTKLPEKFPITSTIQLPSGSPSPIPLVQKQGEKGKADQERLAQIKEACLHAWNGFRQEGWNYDEVRPVLGGGKNSFNGWGATLVDSLDTLWIMGLTEEFEEAVNKTAQIDFTTSSRNDIPLFEVTIRYLGGMLGAYDVSGRKYRVLLDKAVELGELLYSAFDTPNRMPQTYYQWKPAFARNAHLASTRAVMAEIGTLSLEFTRLAQLTLEPKYYDAIARITDEFEKWQNNTRLPGMWPTDLDASGCKKVVRKKATTSKSSIHIPVPNSDDRYMVAGQAVKVEQSVIDKATQTLDKLTQPAGPSQRMGSIANPTMDRVLNGQAAANSNLRHSMYDDNWVKQESPIHADTTNEATAKEPLSPGAASDSGITLENPSAGKRPGEPLLPNAGSQYQKRELEDINNAPSNSTILSSGANDNTFHQVSKKETYDSLSENIVEEEEEEEEDQCEHQGFTSCNILGQDTFTLGGKSDSTYEYLPKQYLLLGGRLEQYKNMYLESMKPVIDKLIFRPMTIDNADILVSGEVEATINYTDNSYIYEHIGKLEHLTCFAGGMFAMGGKLFDLPEHVEIGRKLTDGCVWAYNSTNSGIMPDGATLMVCDDPRDCTWNQTAWYEELDVVGEEYRQQQIDSWKETYDVDDIDAWKKRIAAEEAAASSSAAAAELAAATSIATSDASEDENELPRTVPEPQKGGHDHYKRQLDDLTDVEPPQPQRAPQPPTKSSTPLAGEVPNEDNNDASENLVLYNTPYPGPLESIPTTTAPPKPTYTPDPPPTHLEYVEIRIEEERIPPGFARVGGTGYILRPEAIESVFYMYRITGEQYWRDVGWKMFLAIETATRSRYGHSSIDDVTKTHPGRTDTMESFWIAETLKYFYLLFDDPDTWSLDDWVLNTEAHFFRRPEGPST